MTEATSSRSTHTNTSATSAEACKSQHAAAYSALCLRQHVFPVGPAESHRSFHIGTRPGAARLQRLQGTSIISLSFFNSACSACPRPSPWQFGGPVVEICRIYVYVQPAGLDSGFFRSIRLCCPGTPLNCQAQHLMQCQHANTLPATPR